MSNRATMPEATPASRAYEVMRMLGSGESDMAKLLTAKLRVSKSGRYYFRPEINKVGGKSRPRVWCPREVQLEGKRAVQICLADSVNTQSSNRQINFYSRLPHN